MTSSATENIRQSQLYLGQAGTVRRPAAMGVPMPGFLRPIAKFGFGVLQGVSAMARWSFRYIVREPLFRGRCVTAGKGFHVWKMPYVSGGTNIYVGNNVTFFGKVGIFSGRLFDEPKLILGDRVSLGNDVVFLVNKEIILEDDVDVASGVRFMDTDAHPRDTMERIADLPPRPEEVKPVRIKHGVRIGQSSFIMKGVTIGEGAVIGVNSVVVNDIPAFSTALGNPARVVAKNVNQTVAVREPLVPPN
jgi:acetyltransferase-like isoleucine patch superfamily enzyme